MQEPSPDQIRAELSTLKQYTAIVLRATPKRGEPGAEAIVAEHGKRNLMLRAKGILRIICMVDDESDVRGFGIFDASPEEVRAIYDEDPGVQAGIFTYELHACVSFPRDSLEG